MSERQGNTVEGNEGHLLLSAFVRGRSGYISNLLRNGSTQILVVKPYSAADDVRRKAVSQVTGLTRCHSDIVPRGELT